jgi:hypothetical protein
MVENKPYVGGATVKSIKFKNKSCVESEVLIYFICVQIPMNF